MSAPLKELAEWLVSLDEPDSQPRRTVSLSMIVERAKTALQLSAETSTPVEDSTEVPTVAVGSAPVIPRARCAPDDDPALELVRLSSGQQIIAHAEYLCEGQEACCIHNPSNHHMAQWAQSWRGDRGIMERTCSHGVGHPDPDDIAYRLKHGGVAWAYIDAVHGCDGCCMDAPYLASGINPPEQSSPERGDEPRA